MDGIHLINSLKDNIILMRNSVDRYHNIWYEEALQLAIKVGLEESKSRTVGRQTARANHPFKTISEYYKRTITIPFYEYAIENDLPFVLDFEAKRQRRQPQEQPVQEEQQQQQPETSDSAMVDDILDVDLSGFEW